MDNKNERWTRFKGRDQWDLELSLKLQHAVVFAEMCRK